MAICAEVPSTNTTEEAEREKYTGKEKKINAEMMWLLATLYSLGKLEYCCCTDGFGLSVSQLSMALQSRSLTMVTGS